MGAAGDGGWEAAEVTEEKEMLLLCFSTRKKNESKEQRERRMQRDKQEFYLHESIHITHIR